MEHRFFNGSRESLVLTEIIFLAFARALKTEEVSDIKTWGNILAVIFPQWIPCSRGAKFGPFFGTQSPSWKNHRKYVPPLLDIANLLSFQFSSEWFKHYCIWYCLFTRCIEFCVPKGGVFWVGHLFFEDLCDKPILSHNYLMICVSRQFLERLALFLTRFLNFFVSTIFFGVFLTFCPKRTKMSTKIFFQIFFVFKGRNIVLFVYKNVFWVECCSNHVTWS
jgi:hypothetical protein